MRLRDLLVEGRVIVRDGRLATVDLPALLTRQRRLAEALAWN
jgi:hypothetical protein